MRLLLVAHALPPDTYGGTELYTARLAEAFATDHEVTVAAPRSRGAADADIDGASVVGLPTPATQPEDGVALDPSADVAQPEVDAAFSDVLSSFDPDVVHLQHLKNLSSRLPSLCQADGTPCVLTLHDFWTVCHREQLVQPDGALCSGPTSVGKCTACYADAVGEAIGEVHDGSATFPAFSEPVSRRTARLEDALDAVDLLVSPSAFLRDRFVAFGVSSDDIVQARNGIRVDAFRDEGFDSEGTTRFGYAGRLPEEKGVHLLLEAFAAVDADAELDVYGRFAPDANEYHARLAAMASDDARVTFHGYYDDPAKPFVESDVFVLPSLWYENSPLVIQEAFASGTPVVTADRGGMAELVTDGVDGRTFEPGSADSLADRLQSLASEPRRIRRLREGVEPPKRLRTHANELLDLYAGLPSREREIGDADDGGPRAEATDH